MPSLKEFKCIMEDSINDTLEKSFNEMHGHRDFIVDEIKNMYNSVVSISQKFNDFYAETLKKQDANHPVEALSFVAQMRADSYKNVMSIDQLKYTIMSKIYDALPSELNQETQTLIKNVKAHAEYQALSDRRLTQAVEILTCIKSNNLRAELDLQQSFASSISLGASYSDCFKSRQAEYAEATNLRQAAEMIIKYMPHLKETEPKPISMEQFILDQKKANEPITHKLHIPSMKQVCSFIPTMRTIDSFIMENREFNKDSILLMKKALLAVNGRDVKSVISGLVAAKISIFKTIENDGRGKSEQQIREMKEKASYMYRTVLRDVEGAFKLGYALVVPSKQVSNQSMSLSVA